MKIASITGLIALYGLLLTSCTKDIQSYSINAETDHKQATVTATAASASTTDLTGYTNYYIVSGQHECTPRPFKMVSYSELKFLVRFDSSAVYQNVLPANQADINKLYGFSDNNSHHQSYSARIGWRWFNNELQLLAYVYNKGVVSSSLITAVPIGAVVTCSIKVQKGAYLFTVNGISKSMARAATTIMGNGYQLYPYFGGDENAPHDISIWIKKY